MRKGNAMVDYYEELIDKVKSKIGNIMFLKGIPSRFMSEIVLHIQDEEVMFNLNAGHPSDSYVVEVSEKGLISNYGHTYDFDTLPLEDLCKIVDSLDKQPSMYRVKTVIEDSDKKVYKYFDQEEDAYNEFIDQRATILEEKNENSVIMEVIISERRGRNYEEVHSYSIADSEEDQEDI